MGKRSIIPAGARIGRNVRIGEGVRPSDFTTKIIKSGGSVEAKRARPSASRPNAAASAAADEREAAAMSAEGKGAGGKKRSSGASHLDR